MNYTDEYLSLIEEVAEDGELSKQEIYRLAKWLNDNKEGRTTWPANQFLPLLKDVFADGKIDVAEARQVGALIQQVRRDWARQNSRVQAVEVANPIEAAIASFDDSQPYLLLLPVQIPVQSFQEADTTYCVDLSEPSCTCPDFRSYRAHLPVGHISRCCKHIMQAYSQVRPDRGWPSWLDALLEGGFRPYPTQAWQVAKTENAVYLLSSASPIWGNLYAKINERNEKYGYSIEEERWSYGKEPEHADWFARAICELS